MAQDYKRICNAGTRAALAARDALTAKIWAAYERAGYELDRPLKRIRKDGKTVFRL